MMREAIEHLERELSRRAFLKKAATGAGIAFFWERFGMKFASAQSSTTDPKAVFSAIGNIVIPVDEDPGWATFEPEISQYALDVMVKQVFLRGNELAFQGVLDTFRVMNEIPPMINYATIQFLQMSQTLQAKYLGDIFTGQFENDGVQDILFLAAFVGIFSTKAVFFSNFPNHLAIPGAEFQVRPSGPQKTGWEIMNFKGPIGPEEENALRAKYMDAEILPGVDPKNPYL
ncbi:MAG: hypothetical protein HY313_08000 [Acidobacteria bacterium]|nr:hypothetical protein [Acidobacteriota bacterium]